MKHRLLFLLIFLPLCLCAQTTEYLFTKRLTNGPSVTFGANFLTVSQGNLHIDAEGNIELLTDNELASALSLDSKLNVSGGTADNLTVDELILPDGLKLGTDPYGTLNAFPTATRAWTLPDASGTILMDSSNLNASNLASGTVPTARLGSGTADSTTYLRGDGSWQTVSAGVSLSADNTWTGVQTFAARPIVSVAGAASAPSFSLTGAPYVAGTTTTAKALFLIEPTGTTSTGWIAAGSLFGVNAPSGYTGNIMTIKKNGTTVAQMDGDGTFTLSSGFLQFSSSNYFRNLNGAMNWFGGYLSSATGIGITSSPSSAPDTTMIRVAAGITGLRGASTSAPGALNLLEMTAPSAPSANQVHIYAEDNGSGKTRLMALFPSGAAQQIAIEP